MTCLRWRSILHTVESTVIHIAFVLLPRNDLKFYFNSTILDSTSFRSTWTVQLTVSDSTVRSYIQLQLFYLWHRVCILIFFFLSFFVLFCLFFVFFFVFFVCLFWFFFWFFFAFFWSFLDFFFVTIIQRPLWVRFIESIQDGKVFVWFNLYFIYIGNVRSN